MKQVDPGRRDRPPGRSPSTGAIVGTWASKRSGKRLAVTLEPFDRLPGTVAEALEAEVADIGRFEGLTATIA